MPVDNSDALYEQRRLADAFLNYFEVVQADTPALTEAAYRLRYQVYCIETGFENAAAYPNQLEKDEFDEHSVHALLRYRATGAFVGTVRVILPRKGLNRCLPMHYLQGGSFFLADEQFPRESTAEISRFTISKEFRKRQGEYPSPSAVSEYSLSNLETNGQRVIPHIVLGLFIGMIKISADNGIKHWIFILESALRRLLAKYALHVIPYGPETKYHGLRRPYYVHLEEFLERARRERPDVWELITDKRHFEKARL